MPTKTSAKAVQEFPVKIKTFYSMASALLIGFSINAHAFPEADISIVIPYSPGGGFDSAVRAFGPHFAKQLGKNVTVLPRNVPGAGGRRGTTTVYRAKPDGYTLGIVNLPGFALPRVLGEPAEYDLREMSWIGRIESQDYVLLVAASSSINSIADLQKQKEITFTSTGYGSTILAASQIVANALGLKAKNPIYLTGYAGTSDSLVALLRGDGNVTIAPVSSATKYIQSGDLKALAVSGEVSELKGVPTFAKAGFPELTPLNLQRSIAGPPGMDGALLKRLRDAFNKTMADPEFLAAAQKARMDVAPLNGEKAAAEVKVSFEFYEKFKADLSNPNAK
jgi:tripartite-type tricarboxylate transporter receptor subunit TctC